MKILSIDFGLKKIGLALGEDGFVYPYKVLKRKNFFLHLKNVCQEEKIEAIVIGLPSGSLQKTVEKFSREVAEQTGLPVFLKDETLTSKQAVAKMIEGRVRREKRQKLEDAHAAVLILEEFLRERRGNV